MSRHFSHLFSTGSDQPQYLGLPPRQHPGVSGTNEIQTAGPISQPHGTKRKRSNLGELTSDSPPRKKSRIPRDINQAPLRELNDPYYRAVVSAIKTMNRDVSRHHFTPSEELSEALDGYENMVPLLQKARENVSIFLHHTTEQFMLLAAAKYFQQDITENFPRFTLAVHILRGGNTLLRRAFLIILSTCCRDAHLIDIPPQDNEFPFYDEMAKSMNKLTLLIHVASKRGFLKTETNSEFPTAEQKARMQRTILWEAENYRLCLAILTKIVKHGGKGAENAINSCSRLARSIADVLGSQNIQGSVLVEIFRFAAQNRSFIDSVEKWMPRNKILHSIFIWMEGSIRGNFAQPSIRSIAYMLRKHLHYAFSIIWAYVQNKKQIPKYLNRFLFLLPYIIVADVEEIHDFQKSLAFFVARVIYNRDPENDAMMSLILDELYPYRNDPMFGTRVTQLLTDVYSVRNSNRSQTWNLADEFVLGDLFEEGEHLNN